MTSKANFPFPHPFAEVVYCQVHYTRDLEIEVARKLNNRGLQHLQDFWEDSSHQQISLDPLMLRGVEPLFERALVGRLL